MRHHTIEQALEHAENHFALAVKCARLAKQESSKHLSYRGSAVVDILEGLTERDEEEVESESESEGASS